MNKPTWNHRSNEPKERYAELLRFAAARKAAKDFARHLRTEAYGFAESIPVGWESMSDEEIRYAVALLPTFGLKQEENLHWSAAR